MKTIKIIYTILVCLFIPWLALADNDNPPSSITIYENLDSMWSQGAFDEIDTYVANLQNEYSNYLPARLVIATYQYKCLVNVEQAISALHELRSQIQQNLMSVSPVFTELLDSRIKRYEKTAKFRLDNGYTQTRMFNRLNPQKWTPKNVQKTGVMKCCFLMLQQFS